MDTYFFEIQDAPGEIYDLPEMQDEDDNEESFEQFINGNYTY